VTATLKNGERFTGIFSSASLDSPQSRYTMKMTRKVPSAEVQSNGAGNDDGEYVGAGEDHVMQFEKEDVVDLFISNVSFDKAAVKTQNGLSSSSVPVATTQLTQTGVSAGMKTDVDISGNRVVRQKPLQRWEPSEADNTTFSWDEDTVGSWDQFATNERLTGQKSTYDEDQYTTTINRSGPGYAANLARAEQIEREILGSKAMNSHIAEERGLAGPDDSGLDEEEKYAASFTFAADQLLTTSPDTVVSVAALHPSSQGRPTGTLLPQSEPRQANQVLLGLLLILLSFPLKWLGRSLRTSSPALPQPRRRTPNRTRYLFPRSPLPLLRTPFGLLLNQPNRISPFRLRRTKIRRLLQRLPLITLLKLPSIRNRSSARCRSLLPAPRPPCAAPILPKSLKMLLPPWRRTSWMRSSNSQPTRRCESRRNSELRPFAIRW
jgi:hypothetical protein